ncbi:MAG: T9SS type A sorting domain-containing protein [Bacteroidales bacterium]|nr:T9SS type A sorting domain-containing protein [Bacteroidales bacterium]
MKTMKGILIILLIMCSGIINAQWVVIDTCLTVSTDASYYISPFMIRFIDDGVMVFYYKKEYDTAQGGPVILRAAKTINDGLSWNTIFYIYSTESPYFIYDIQFPNADTGFIGFKSDGAPFPIPVNVYRTTNGGSSWEGVGGSTPQKMFFINGRKGYGVEGKIFKRYKDNAFISIDTLDFATYLEKMLFTNNEIGYWIARIGSSWCLIRTMNDGDNWEVVISSDTKYFFDFAVPSDSVCYIACGSGCILKSINYGETWDELSLNTSQNIKSISFIDNLNGYALCNDNYVYRTNDGGALWHSQSIPSFITHTQSIKMIDENIGYIRGSIQSFNYNYLGVLLKTENGGFPSINAENEYNYILEAYPNPFTNYLNVELKPDYKKIEICDLKGLTVYSQKLTQNNNQILKIDLSNLDSGIYFLKIKTNDNYLIRKLIKL